MDVPIYQTTWYSQSEPVQKTILNGIFWNSYDGLNQAAHNTSTADFSKSQPTFSSFPNNHMMPEYPMNGHKAHFSRPLHYPENLYYSHNPTQSPHNRSYPPTSHAHNQIPYTNQPPTTPNPVPSTQYTPTFHYHKEPHQSSASKNRRLPQESVAVLEELYKMKSRLGTYEKREVSEATGLTIRQIHCWFTRRQEKFMKETGRYQTELQSERDF
ncbi:hypothetical protein B9Z55_026627 [Caenorhabditis nigoni]|nr:hypothetical protein B9Z55_026627 [Caenorhabditis nigoni]